MATPQVVLSRYQAGPLLGHRASTGEVVQVSPDLGRTAVQARIGDAGVEFPGGPVVLWPHLQEIASSDNGCFVCDDQGLQRITVFSAALNRVYSLMPTAGAPTLLISGIPMHRIKDTDPHADTLEKVKALRPLIGDVLDTSTGLGYTAIQATRTAAHVTTVELDPAVLEVARLNPWSQALFTTPTITQRIGDCAEVIEEFADESFDRILHDPPAFSLAGQLYGLAFYRQLHRVLRPAGLLFHYVGDPESRSGGNITRGVLRRLEEAGFERVARQPAAFGVVARRGRR